MNSWHSYPKIYNLGHAAVNDLIRVEVIGEEKIDGSQFSFGVDAAGELHVRSKGQEMDVQTPEKMFEAAVATAKDLSPCCHPGWTYRCEYLQKPKHNTLCYERIPIRHLILFDVNTSEEGYLLYDDKVAEGKRIGLEVVPKLFSGRLEGQDPQKLIEHQSMLGGSAIEGMVFKPAAYELFGVDKKVLMGKFVSERFKEVHSKEWRKENPTSADILAVIGLRYVSEARWDKAVQHLREAGVLENSPRDIGLLLKEVPADIVKECEEDIKAQLWKWAWPHIRRQVARGFPEWYKTKIAADQLGEKVQ